MSATCRTPLVGGRTVTRRTVLVGGASVVVAVIAGCSSSGGADGGAGAGAATGGGSGVGAGAGGGAVSEPVASTVHRWSADPYAGGTYSFLPPGVTDEARATLAAPVGPRLVLAGEATSVEHPSTVPGRLLSGRRAAEQLADELDPADGTVVVVGAGVAGLAAARDLIDAGFEVVVLDDATAPVGASPAPTSAVCRSTSAPAGSRAPTATR
ncbi:MAG: FAD-dependent oxidoreductase [Acidimicrobiales bacterium]